MTAMPLAPEFPGALEWVNAPAPALRQQRGRISLVVFWHAGSAWCENLLDELRLLQARYSDTVSVFAIHTPKFTAERDPALLRRTLQRLQLRFPVAHDPDFVAWQHYGVRGWPTVALVDPQGRLLELRGGDQQRDALEARLLQLIDETGLALRRGDPPDVTLPPMPASALAFPSGIAATASHLYVADTGHHRVLECTHDGRVLRQFGSGNPGLLDGAGTEASFHSPRGMTVLKEMLYVCDTGNHALRRVRLLDGDVDTLAGTGRAGAPDTQGGAAAGLSLNAPWDVAGEYERLYLSMAGWQQVWEFDLAQRRLRPLAGNGRLGLVDGAGGVAQMAQPAGVALVQHTLYVADAAGSAIRSVNVATGNVQTLVGHGGFEFGDQDGSRSNARLQYPLALALDPRSPLLWIADTGNQRLRMLRLGGGELRRHDLDHALVDPGAVATSPGALWLCNSGAHEVLRVDLEEGGVSRLPVGE